MPAGSGTTPVLLTFAADMREYMGASAAYYGNCVANQRLAAATNGAVASADLVRMVRHAKAQLPDKLKEELGSGRLFAGVRYDMLHMS